MASLVHLLDPAAVAVVGASRKEGSVGRTILRNIRDAGFAGRVYAVNPNASEIDGALCVRSVTALPEPVDLAVIAHIRHEHTNYDELLMSGTERLDARALVREAIDRVLAEWSGQ